MITRLGLNLLPGRVFVERYTIHELQSINVALIIAKGTVDLSISDMNIYIS